jgi:HEAT repeat protein
VESSPVTRETSEYLAGFLGAASHVWVAARRLRLLAALARGGVLSVPPILEAVARTPREEVIDDAVAALGEIARRDASVLAGFVAAISTAWSRANPRPPVLDHASTRVVLVRVIGGTGRIETRDERVAALANALRDPSIEVRDAAIQALVSTQDRAAMRVLEMRLGTEPEPFLRNEITEAIAELRCA